MMLITPRPILFLVIALAGCSPAAPSPETEQTAQQAEPAAAPPAYAAPDTMVLAAGAALDVRLMDRLDSAANQTGDVFGAQLAADLTVGEEVVLPAGSVFRGELRQVAGSARVRGRAEMTLVLTGLEMEGETYPIRTGEITVQAEGTQGRDAAAIGGAAGVGALVGAVIGGRKGAAVGAAAGGGAGTAGVLMTKGNEVVFEKEQAFSFELLEDLEIPLVR